MTVRHQGQFVLNSSWEGAFPLFTPVGEKKWSPEWDFQPVLGTDPVEEDDVFLTKMHDHGRSAALWLVKRYDPQHGVVQYYKIEPEIKVGLVTVTCRPYSDTSCQIEVSYRYTSLGPEGDEFLTNFSEEAFRRFLDDWRVQISYFLSWAKSNQ